MDHRATTVPRRVMQQRWELIYPCPQAAQRNEATWHNIVNPAYVGVWRRSNECDVTLTIEIPQEWSLWKSLGSDPCSLPSPPVHRKTNNCIHVVVQYDVMTELLHVSNRSRFFKLTAVGEIQNHTGTFYYRCTCIIHYSRLNRSSADTSDDSATLKVHRASCHVL